MKAKRTVRGLLIVIFLVTIIGSDQICKSIVRQKIDYNERTILLGKFVTLTRVENTGAFLSLGDSMPRILYKILMIILPLVVIGYALYYILTKNDLSKLMVTGICLIIGGGLGNIIDRIIYGSVTDFLQFDFVLFHTGIVNIADISVTAGFFILLYEMYFKSRIFKHMTSESDIK